MPYNHLVSVQTRLVLGALSVFNGGVLILLGVLAALYIDGSARILVALVAWVAAVGLFALARRLRRGAEWN
jgi:hypothetical protein